MKRFSLKISNDLFEKIKKNGTQQSAIDDAIKHLSKINCDQIIFEKGEVLKKQITFAIDDDVYEKLVNTLHLTKSRSFLKVIRFALDKSLRKNPKVGLFLKGLDKDLQGIAQSRIRDEWTHDSTSIEGNTFTLGETSFVLKEGLTISGKSVKEHDEIRGHANAIDIIYHLANQERLSDEDLYELHRAVMVNSPFDIDNPVGQWKRVANGAYHERQYISYPAPNMVPNLMKQWVDKYNNFFIPETHTEAVKLYSWVLVSFTAIHPFFDGNGRLARLLANIKVISQGFPPITIDSSARFEYLNLIKNFRLNTPEVSVEMDADPKTMEKFIFGQWQKTLNIIDEMRDIQRTR
jgi:fido (protein-threonine AMPylation protein)